MRFPKTRLLAALLLLACSARLAVPQHGVPNKADRILILKSAHTLTLMNNGQAIKTYKVALGDPKGPKVQAGDKKTPEGTYFIDEKNPHSLFHRALHLSYPSLADRERARNSA